MANPWSAVTLAYDWYSGQTFRIGVGRDAPPDRIQVRSYRDVLDECRVHPEPKSLGPDGLPCHRATVGLLRRRPVTAGEVAYIGKESNALGAVELGLVHDLSEVRQQHADPNASPWAQARPILATMPIKYLAKISRCSGRMIKYLRAGQRQPSPQARARLIRAAHAWAMKQTN